MHNCRGVTLRAVSKNTHNPVHGGCPQGGFCQGVRKAQDHLRDREGPGRIEPAAVLLEEDRQAPNLQGSQKGSVTCTIQSVSILQPPAKQDMYEIKRTRWASNHVRRAEAGKTAH